MSCIATRIEKSYPVDESVRGEFDLMLEQLVASPEGFLRRAGYNHATNAGYAREEGSPWTARLRRAAETDPDAEVRRVAQLKLDQAAGLVTTPDCPTCPKGGSP